MKPFSGVGVALITPFTSSLTVDFAALDRLLTHITTSGVDFLVVMGTTAEAATLTKGEREQVLQHCLNFNKGCLPIIYGIGGNNTQQVIDDVKANNLQGISGILTVTPYYNKPNQQGLYAHYAAIAEASPLPLMLYNVPGRTGVNMTADTTLRLAHDFPDKICGVKEASGNLSQAAYILRDRPTDFSVISGDDNLTLPLLALGADGVISVSVNAFPKRFTTMVHAAMQGRYSEAASLNLTLHEVTDLLFTEGNPTGVKTALALQGLIDNYLRLPLVAASDGLRGKIAEQIKKYDL